MAEGLEPRFLADRNVGSLAKWLRLAGFDAAFADDRQDSEILIRALVEGRVLLTRDRHLKDRAPAAVYLVRGANLEDQLREVLQYFGLKWRLRLLSRCVECNVGIERVTRAAVKGRVPPRVFARHAQFFRCPHCAKIFWPGSHAGRVEAAIRRTVADLPASGDKMGAEENRG